MREILFRGKRSDTSEWIDGSMLKVTIDSKTSYLIFGDNFSFAGSDVKSLSHAVVDPSTVGQYTGLTDKNGTRIFEGDIVTGLFLFGMPVNAVVRFSEGAFGLEWLRGKARQFDAFTSVCNVTYEVVGNIYDNPELVEEMELRRSNRDVAL